MLSLKKGSECTAPECKVSDHNYLIIIIISILNPVFLCRGLGLFDQSCTSGVISFYLALHSTKPFKYHSSAEEIRCVSDDIL